MKGIKKIISNYSKFSNGGVLKFQKSGQVPKQTVTGETIQPTEETTRPIPERARREYNAIAPEYRAVYKSMGLKPQQALFLEYANKKVFPQTQQGYVPFRGGREASEYLNKFRQEHPGAYEHMKRSFMKEYELVQ